MRKKIKEELTNFEKGQLYTLNEIIDCIKNDIVQIESQKTGYMLRETAKDALYPYKALIKINLWEHMLNQVEQMRKTITKEDEEE